jgi:hypothetical protein
LALAFVREGGKSKQAGGLETKKRNGLRKSSFGFNLLAVPAERGNGLCFLCVCIERNWKDKHEIRTFFSF